MIGPSGSGKSTFIRCLNRLEEPTDGAVIFEGQQINTKGADIDKIRQKIGMVFQNFNLFSNMTIMQNITAAPINVKKIPKAQAEERALKLLDRVGLKDKAGEYPCVSPAASASVLPLPVRWLWIRTFFYLMSQPPHWTRKWSARF